jgi:hypothetical protein
MKDPNFTKYMMGPGDIYMREAPEWVEVPPEQCPNVRNISRPMAEFKFDGATMKMITARWEKRRC